ncbi:sugar ABC transporter substrate-binding protein [Streptomyces sp. NPDC001941]|uniref:ABC transporter substrate-binding protein n=1 Tax=Streptomyces sp. NPDC001941 TaxID=3154659 RepID=UPI00332D5975
MSIHRRAAMRTLVGLGAVLSLTALTGCGGGDGEGSSTSGKVGGEIKFQTWNLRANFKDYFEGLIADFEKQNPGTKVKWVDQPADGYPDKLSADASAGTLPDVVNLSPDLAYPLAKAGILLNLDKDNVASTFKGEYLEGAWKGYEMPGLDGSYGFPWYLNSGPLFYNKTMFKGAGLDPAKAPKTFDELFADAKQLAAKGKATLGQPPTIEDFGRYGVPLMDAAGSKFTLNDPKGVELLTKYQELFKSGGLHSQALTLTPETTGQKFLQQQLAMNPGSAHDLENFKKNAPGLYQNLGITDVPTNTGSQNMYLQGLSVNKQSKNAATAVAFAHFVTDQKNQEAFGHEVAVFPSTKGSLDKEYWTKADGTEEGRIRVATAAMLPKAVNYTPVLLSDEMKTILRNEIAKCFQGKSSPREALDGAVGQMNKLLEQK